MKAEIMSNEVEIVSVIEELEEKVAPSSYAGFLD